MTSPSIPSSELAFRNGLAALERRAFKESIALLQSAIDQERTEGAKNPKMKYVSYLGLAITLSNGRSEEGVKLCEQAVKRDFFDPDLFCNLGIVYLRNRQKAHAFNAFQKGLSLKPNHSRIREELERYEMRDSPIFNFLPRGHLINRMAGMLRYRLRSILGSGSQN